MVCISNICYDSCNRVDLVKLQVALLAADPPDNVEASTRRISVMCRATLKSESTLEQRAAKSGFTEISAPFCPFRKMALTP
jgi:hypothetical protein